MTSDYKKIIFKLKDGFYENLFAIQLNTKNLYRIANIPFWTNSVAYGAIIQSKTYKFILHFSRIIKRSGNKTIRVIFKDNQGFKGDNARKILNFLDENGYKCEGLSPNILTINICPKNDCNRLVNYLNKFCNKKISIYY